MIPIKVYASRSAAAKKPSKSLGSLPEWNLTDLYPAMDAPEIKRDLDRGEAECFEFEKAYKGRLADIAPTLLELMDLPKPKEMTGTSLLRGN